MRTYAALALYLVGATSAAGPNSFYQVEPATEVAPISSYIRVTALLLFDEKAPGVNATGLATLSG